MVSEGVDIPRLRVGVYATNTVTELFFRQAVGRLVRWNARLGRQAAYMFIPDDVRLRKFGGAIAEQRPALPAQGVARRRRRPPRDEGANRRRRRRRPSAIWRSSCRCSRPSRRRARRGRPADRKTSARLRRTADDDPNGEIPDSRAGAPATTARAFRWTCAARGPVPPGRGRRALAAPKNSMLARRRQLREQNAARSSTSCT
jgi:superfamily II DNA or RNA helicase